MQTAGHVRPSLDMILFASHMLNTARTEPARNLFKQYLDIEMELLKRESHAGGAMTDAGRGGRHRESDR